MEPTEPLAGIRPPEEDDESGDPTRGTRGRQGAGAAAGPCTDAAGRQKRYPVWPWVSPKARTLAGVTR